MPSTKQKAAAPRRRSRILLGNAVSLLLLLAAAAGVLLYALGENYPLFYRGPINALLGRGRWEVTDSETRSDEHITDRLGDPVSYRQWTIQYDGPDGRAYEFLMTNRVHRASREVSNQSRLPFWERSHVGRRRDFTMNMQRIIAQYAAQQVESDVVAGVFDPADVRSSHPAFNERGVCIDVAVGNDLTWKHGFRSDQISQLHYERGYRLGDTAVEDLIATGRNDIQGNICTLAAAEETLADVDRRAAALGDALIERYGEYATFEIRVFHYEPDENVYEDHARRQQFHFAHRGNPLTVEEVAQKSLTPGTPRMEFYLNENPLLMEEIARILGPDLID